MQRRYLSGLAALVLSAAGLGATVSAATPANAATGCSVAYTVPSQWSTGFTTNLVITNLGSPITSWTLTYSYTGNQTIANGWNGNWTQSGENVTVTNVSYNGSLGTGASTSLGANFNYSGTNTAPTSFSINGQVCTGSVTTTGSIMVNPTTLSVPEATSATVGVSLSAAPSSNVTVSVSSSGNTGLTASPTSLTFTPSNFSTAQNLTITADSSGTGTTTFTLSAAGLTSATVSAAETAPATKTVMVNPTTLSVQQSSTGTVGVSLSAAPSSNVTVSVSSSGNTGLTASPTSLTFTPSNFSTAQNVTITANSSGTGTTTFTLSATGYTSATVSATETAPNNNGAAAQLHVSGNKLLNASGQQVILRGINRSGGEYSCVQGNGIFDGEMDQAAITAMKSWGVNAVRLPMNEACWNAESYVPAADAGANYQNAFKSEVNLLNSNGLDVILDLHWTDGLYTGNSAGNCTSAQAAEAFCQKPMPDAAQAIPFWSSVAAAFKGNDAVIFDLFNEPFASRADNNNNTEGWQCWETGSPCTGISYPVAGMQQMVNAVRSAGANNVIMLGGEEFSNDLTSWLQFKPTDPDNNLVASWHSYNFNTCSNQSCWTSQVAPVIAQVPVVAGEIGENDCSGSYINPLTTWLDSQNTSYLAWAWNADFNCSSGPSLITDYVPGDPTAFGAAYKAHLASLGL